MKQGTQQFVIQKHTASHAHFDFRLQMIDPETKELTLISWAVPKNLPFEEDVKHLAIRTENHKLSFLNFEGVIPEGSYGAGEVRLWDRGKWGMMSGDLVKGRLAFTLFGENTKGRFQMVRMSEVKSGREGKNVEASRNWLIWRRDRRHYVK